MKFDRGAALGVMLLSFVAWLAFRPRKMQVTVGELVPVSRFTGDGTEVAWGRSGLIAPPTPIDVTGLDGPALIGAIAVNNQRAAEAAAQAEFDRQRIFPGAGATM